MNFFLEKPRPKSGWTRLSAAIVKRAKKIRKKRREKSVSWSSAEQQGAFIKVAYIMHAAPFRINCIRTTLLLPWRFFRPSPAPLSRFIYLFRGRVHGLHVITRRALIKAGTKRRICISDRGKVNLYMTKLPFVTLTPAIRFMLLEAPFFADFGRKNVEDSFPDSFLKFEIE